MYIPLTVMIVSGGVFTLLIFLFRKEKKHSMRYGEHFRIKFDNLLVSIRKKTDAWHPKLNEYSLKQTGHFVLHKFLSSLLVLLGRIEKSIRFFLKLNKRRASSSKRRSSSDSSLSAVLEHKKESQLSEEEKKKRSEEALLGN